MQNIFFRLIPVTMILLASLSPALGFGGESGKAADNPTAAVSSSEVSALTIQLRQPGTEEILEVSLFSEKYAQAPVAMVNEEPITLQEFTSELAKMHGSMTDSDTPRSQSFNKLLERLISIKLVTQEALNIGFDQTPAFQKQVEEFELKTMVKQLLARQVANVHPDEAAIEELYKQMALEVKVRPYKFSEQADAETFLEEVQKGEDFKALADKLVAAGKAQGAGEPDFARLNDLIPNVAKAVFSMEVGQTSQVFKAEKDFVVFRLEDRRIYEDPQARLAAENLALKEAANRRQAEYLNELIDKYATFHEDNLTALDFKTIVAENPDETRIEVFTRLSNDQRPLVTLTDGKEVVTITVAEVIGDLQSAMYHGSERKIDPNQLNNQKIAFIKDRLTSITGELEAKELKILTSPAYLDAVASFKERLLFDTFMAKAVVPGLMVTEEATREYYYNHLEDYSSPMMLTMKSLVFTDQQNAQDAVTKLQAGTDFKWVSANMTGLAAADHEGILDFGGKLLTETALPEALRKQVVTAKPDDVLLYPGADGLYYTMVIETVFPPKAKLYEEVRQEIGKIVYAQVIEEAFEEWVTKLKEAYETEIYIVEDSL